MPLSAQDDQRRLILGEKQGLVRLELAMPFLDAAALEELSSALDRIEDAAGRAEIRGLVIAATREGLPGGPNPAPLLDAEGRDELASFAARGNEIARRIERLPIPVVATLEGQCLDSGLEIALAAHVRIGRAGRGLRIGLPGLDASLPPLFGGLSRLVEIVGLRRGLDIVLERRRLSGTAALESGLLAELAPGSALERRAAERVEELAAAWRAGHHGNPSRRKVGLTDYLTEELAFFRRFELGRFRRRIRRLERPADLARLLLTQVESGLALPRFERLERESLAAAGIAAAPATRHRLSIVRRGDDRVRSGPYAPAGAAVALPRRVAIMGAGLMGRRLALALLGRGLKVQLFDPFPEALVGARRALDAGIDDQVRRGRLRPAAARRVRDRLLIEPEPRDLRDVDLVVECVPEVLALKQEVLRHVAEITRPETLLVSHSASLAPEELRRGLPHGRRLQSMHLYMPEDASGLCEIVRDRDSAHADLAVLARVARELGRFPLVSSGPAPFACGRLLCTYVAEALRLFAEGWSPRSIDGAARDFGFELGPLERLDLVGVDVVLAMSRRLEEDSSLGFRTPEALTALLERGETGRRAGLGVRVWSERGPVPRNESDLRRICGLQSVMMDQDRRLIGRRLVDPLVFAGRQLLDRKVVSGADELDLLSVHGLGFPASLGGLATHAEESAS